MASVTPGGGLSSDVGMIITAAFPGGKPEMSANDFQKAYEITKSSLAGNPRPAKTSLDYALWAHCMMVEWRVLCDRAKAACIPEPNQMHCPECGVAMLLDHSQNDVLTCPGGCNRAITIQAFTALFKSSPPKKSVKIPAASQAGSTITYTGNGWGNAPWGGGAGGSGAATSSGNASIGGSIPEGVDPVAKGIVEKMPKSRKPLEGWRAWTVDNDGLTPRLRSLNGAVWEPMEPMYGQCYGKNVKDLDHKCPSWHHRCGVYAVKTVPDVKRWKSSFKPIGTRVSVLGQVEMWGRVLEYEDGFRCEHAYPLRLWLPETWDDNLNFELWKTPQDLGEMLWGSYLVEINYSDEVIYELQPPRE